jgi:hypothetical protein
MADWFAHFRARRGGREILPPAGHGVERVRLKETHRVGIGSITSRQTATDLEVLAFIHGITVTEVKRRLGR